MKRNITQRSQWFEDALAVPFTEAWVPVNGAKIHYLEWKSAENLPPLVLIHGNGAHAHWFHFIGALLSDQYHCVAITMSGQGDSGWRDYYVRETFRDDVLGVIDHLGFKDNIHILGHSFGGLVATLVSDALQSRVAATIFADFFPEFPEENEEWFTDDKRNRPTRRYASKEEIVARFKFMPEQECDNTYLVDYIIEHSIRHIPTEGWTWKFDHGLYDNMTKGDDLALIILDLPHGTGLIYGEDTVASTPEKIATMPEKFPSPARIKWLENAGHHLMFDKPLEFVEEVRSMFQKISHANASGVETL